MADVILSLIDLPRPQIWLVQANRLKGISEISQMICGQIVAQGGMVVNNESKLLQLWPNKLLLLIEEIESEHLAQLKSNLTDVSHGYNFLQLQGDSSLEFINAHVPVDLESGPFLTHRVARSQFESYSVIFWWDKPDTVQLLIDRSYAESFREYLESLINLWRKL
jgi:heterotetrameric sarcosine oxidase gamma subunit